MWQNDIIKNTMMYFWRDNENFEWASINRSIDQLTETRVVNIFARQHARDGPIIKHALLLRILWRVYARVGCELAKDKG